MPYTARVNLIPDDDRERRYSAKDLSESGLRLGPDEDADLLPLGQLVEIVLEQEDAPGAFDAEVVRHTGTNELAVRFVNVTTPQREFLRELVERSSSDVQPSVGSYSSSDVDFDSE